MRSDKWTMVGYVYDHSPDTYRMYDLDTKMIKSTRDIRWPDWKRNDPASLLSLFERAKKQEQQKKEVQPLTAMITKQQQFMDVTVVSAAVLEAVLEPL
jgi:hypothetical protein